MAHVYTLRTLLAAFVYLGLSLLFTVQGQRTPDGPADKMPYQLYDANGRRVTFRDLLNAAAKADVVFFGELHDNVIAHWLSYELAHDLFKRKQKVQLGAEMFETDQQAVLDSVLAEQIALEELPKHTRTWPNYPTDYQPLVRLALEHQLAFYATNVPRKYARMVSRQGVNALDSLSANDKALFMPLPLVLDYELPGYAGMAKLMGAHDAATANSPAMRNMVAAQALKDATMAWSIAQNYKPGYTFVHVNGSYHSNRHGQNSQMDGIPYYLERLKPGLRMLIIDTVVQHDLAPLHNDNRGRADFTLVVPESFPRSY